MQIKQDWQRNFIRYCCHDYTSQFIFMTAQNVIRNSRHANSSVRPARRVLSCDITTADTHHISTAGLVLRHHIVSQHDSFLPPGYTLYLTLTIFVSCVSYVCILCTAMQADMNTLYYHRTFINRRKKAYMTLVTLDSCHC